MLKTLALIAAMTAAQTTDTLTTCQALHSGRFAEANGVLPSSCGGIATVKGVSLVGGVSLVVVLRKKHPKLAKFVGISWIIAGATGTVLNLRTTLQ